MNKVLRSTPSVRELHLRGEVGGQDGIVSINCPLSLRLIDISGLTAGKEVRVSSAREEREVTILGEGNVKFIKVIDH